MSPVVGIDVGGTKIAGALVDDDLRVLHRARMATPNTQSEIIGTLTAMVEAFALRADRPVRAVGVAAPSMVRQPGGRVVLSINTDLNGVALADVLGARTGREVVVDNDGNLAALAEHHAGAAVGARDAVLLTLGTGVGGGVITGGALFRGRDGTGAELGHIGVDMNGPPCLGRCPGRGCLEAYASGTALHRAADALADAHPRGDLATARRARPLDAPHLCALAREGHREALGLLQVAARALGSGMAAIANVFHPEVIVVGGGLAAAWEQLVAPAAAVLAQRVLPPNADVHVVPARFGDEAGVMGAAILARSSWKNLANQRAH